MGKKLITLEDVEMHSMRFLHRVDRSAGPNGCWKLHTKQKQDSYINVTMNGHIGLAHRIAYMLAKGAIPNGLMVCHNCPGGDNKWCVNPKHMFLGTAKEHGADRVKKKQVGAWTHPERLARGDRQGSRKHPKTRPRGDNHWSRKHPEEWKAIRARSKCGAYTHPEKVRRGENHGRCKIGLDKIVELQNQYKAGGVTMAYLAKEFSICQNAVCNIVNGKHWSAKLLKGVGK
jgi:hypothetical protein